MKVVRLYGRTAILGEESCCRLNKKNAPKCTVQLRDVFSFLQIQIYYQSPGSDSLGPASWWLSHGLKQNSHRHTAESGGGPVKPCGIRDVAVSRTYLVVVKQRATASLDGMASIL